MFVKSVEAQFVQDPKEHEYTDRHTHSQTGDIDQRKNLMLFDVSQGGDEVISKHGYSYGVRFVNLPLFQKGIEGIQFRALLRQSPFISSSLRVASNPPCPSFTKGGDCIFPLFQRRKERDSVPIIIR